MYPFTWEQELDHQSEVSKKQSALDTQVGGNHYKDMPFQPLDFIIKNKIPYCEANIIKYVCRHKCKNGVEDLEKAMHYLDVLIEQESK